MNEPENVNLPIPQSRSTVRLDGGDGLLIQLVLAKCGSCTCLTKTPEPQYHANNCIYRLLSEAADAIVSLREIAERWAAIETLMILGDVELTQAEDGGYRISVEPVENILPQSWDGNTPEQVADKVVAQLTTPNAELTGASGMAAKRPR